MPILPVLVLLLSTLAFPLTGAQVVARTDLGLSALEQLRLSAVDTPRSIFPGRRIARLDAGYEASALALTCDPLADRTCVGRIARRLKQGMWIEVPPMPAVP